MNILEKKAERCGGYVDKEKVLQNVDLDNIFLRSLE